MNKFLEDLKAKGDKLVEIAQAEDAMEQGKVVLRSLKSKVIFKNAKKELKMFYSDANFTAIKDMIQQDISALNVAVPKAKKLDKMAALKQQYGGGSVKPTSNQSAKVLRLNFYNIYVELKAQELIYAKYPNVFKTSLQLAKYTEILASVNSLKSQIQSFASKHNATAAFNNELNKKNLEIQNYGDIISLIK